MAQLYPDIESIEKLNVSPTEGEWALIQELTRLDDTFEVYFQPYINGDEPDIVVLRKNKGLVIIEVKDWNLNAYCLRQSVNNWYTLKGGEVANSILSPFKQVEEYKRNIYDLHSIQFGKSIIQSSSAYSIIKIAVYFHSTVKNDLDNFLEQAADKKEALKFLKVWTGDQLSSISWHIQNLLEHDHDFFTDEHYVSLKRYLQPPFHRKEEGKKINYSKAQREAATSVKGARQKFKGVAGSGKTLVLAKRAVDAHLRTNQKVLILTFNISLVNYIRDRINDVREDFPWSAFEIINYHQFFKAKATNYSLKRPHLGDWENVHFFEEVKTKIQKYHTILIDEYQDYRIQWAEIVIKYFLAKDGEYVVFGDEKQNIYNRSLDEEKAPVAKGIPGRWNTSLNITYRLATRISDLAMIFQKNFFNQKYDIDKMEMPGQEQLELHLGGQGIVEYHYFNDTQVDNEVLGHMWGVITEKDIHPSDIGILAIAVEPIRELDQAIRSTKGEKTMVMFESQKEYELLCKRFTRNGEVNKIELNKSLEKRRRQAKLHFWMKTGTIKLSTIHSFKGWELHSAFLLITQPANNSQEEVLHELVYTAITRARMNLFIINLGYEKYNNFFQELNDYSGGQQVESIKKSRPEKVIPQIALESAKTSLPISHIDFPVPKMVHIEGGTFQMGRSDYYDEKPIHQVTLDSFELGKYPVTQREWQAIMGENSSHFKGEDLPVECVSWNDCQVFIQKLNKKTGLSFRLPTEAEWEYAAGGGNQARQKWAGTDAESELGDYAWYDENIGGKTHPVGQKKPTLLGLYDMSGNIFEWCQDWYGDYPREPQANPTGPENGESRVLRGGSWLRNADYCRVANRSDNGPGRRSRNFGLRLARTP